MATRRRWFQFSLRGLLALLTVLAIWLGIVVKRNRDEQQVVKTIEVAGGRIQYDWQSIERDPFPADPAPIGPVWLRRAVEDDYFQSAESVSFLNGSIDKSQIIALVPALQRLRGLKRISIPPDMSEAEKTKLRAALPNCEIWFPTF